MVLLACQDTGGSPITNYVVEKQDVTSGSDKWEPLSRFVRGTDYEVAGLDAGHEYKFRVIAENEVGRGPPLEAEKSVVAKNPFSERIHLHSKLFIFVYLYF